MNKLEEIFYSNQGPMIGKWKHYFEIYDRHLSRYIDKEVNVLEIGVDHGGSLNMWRDYFGKHANIYGVDINPKCKELEGDRIKVFIGNQEDTEFLGHIIMQIPKLDILIDDGGHMMKQQITTFELLFNHIDNNGIYICEDLHTSYWNKFGGGYKNKKSFAEYSKNFIDYINAWHSKTRRLQVSEFTRTVHGLHYYDSMLVIEKRAIKEPELLQSGMFTTEAPKKISLLRHPRQWIVNKISRSR
ncbi:class I SAM-dependent methyltransferase [Thermodesulfobacteriota bacterium]